MVDQLDVPRTDWRPVTALFLALCLVAMLASVVTPALIPTLGLIVVGAGLFLPPRLTAVVGTTAVLLAAMLMLRSEANYGPIRLTNVLLASVLAVLASLMLARRLQRIEQKSRTEAAVLASVPDALFVLDSEGRVCLANAGLTDLVPAARVGEPLHPLLGHVLADGTPCSGGCALDGGTPSHATLAPVEGERITRAGELIQVAYSMQPLQRSGVAVSLRDVRVRVADQSQARALLEARTRREEQSRLLRALDLSWPPGETPLPGVVVDVWHEGEGSAGPASGSIGLSALPDDRVLAIVVDPMEGATLSGGDAWNVMYTARAHVSAGAHLADLVGTCAQILARDGGAPSATLLGVVIDPDTGLVQVASGGHLPPLLVRPDGSSTWLEASGRAIGAARPGSSSIASAELRPGDLLLLYTSEVVAGRGDLVEGLSSLRATAVAMRHQPSKGWAQRALTAVHAGSHDRATLAALRVGGAGPVPLS